jgi:DNA repair exonuclease SbcCD nuclease subunit
MEQCKILFIGDPHFKVTNLEIVDEFISQCLLHLTPDIDLCLIAGDVLHTHERLHTAALNKATYFINQVRKRCPTYVLVGNHDYENNQQFLTNRHWMNPLKEWNGQNTFIIDNTTIINIKSFSFVMVPYVPPGRFVEALNVKGDEWRSSSCIFAHQEFYGCKMGAIESTEGDKWDISFPLVVSGHIHSEQRVQENIFYPGSVIQHAFGESENNGLLLLTFIKGGCDPIMTKIILDIPRMKTINVKIADFADLVVDPKKNERVKIICKGSVEAFKALKRTKHFKNIIDKGVKIQFKFLNAGNAGCALKNEVKNNEQKFSSILEKLILNENNKSLTEMYKTILKDHV